MLKRIKDSEFSGGAPPIKHYANRLYATEDAALADPPHPGARPPRVVMITTSKSRFNELFDNKRSLVADLRNI